MKLNQRINKRINKRVNKKRVRMSNMFKTILVYLRMVVDCVIDLLFSWYWDKWQDPIPDLEKKYAFLAESATSLAGKIRRKELKSEELVQAVIYRIKEVNPMLNAVAEDCFDTAMSEAREADKLIENGLSPEEAKKKPFLGVPFTTKECQAVKNRKWTMGLWLRRNERAHRDSRTVELMREAGAIPVATTNLPEMLIWQETRNPVYGMTNNPHHTGRSPGGSSGAEAALSASYASTISLCSDLGGSTRMPAFYCGVFGHHPTCGTTDLRGVFFRDGGEESMLTLGFISKHAEDLAPLTRIIVGSHADRMGLDRNLDIKDIKFYYLESADDCHVSAVRPELKRAMRTVVSKLTQIAPNTASAPEPYYHSAFNHMYSLWSYWMSKEPDNYAKIYGCGSEGKAWIELLKKVLGMSKHYLFPILRLFEMQVLPKPDPKWADKLTQDCKDDLFNKLGANGVLLMPSAPHPAPYHYSCYFRPFNFAYWGIVNVLKAPATQVPLGRNNQGLPLGIQVVAAPYNDGLCLTVAKYLEKEFGGSVLPCKVKQ